MTFNADHQHIQPVTVRGMPPQSVAATLLQGFDRHYALFRYGAQRAKALFESGDWRGIQQLSRERIEYYDIRVRECTTLLGTALKGSDASPVDASANTNLTPTQIDFWQQVKTEFVALITGHDQPECAETFFNSVSCRILHRSYFNNDFLFVRPAIATEYIDGKQPSYRSYYPASQGLAPALTQLISDYGLATAYADLPVDVRRLARAGTHWLRQAISTETGQRIAPDCQIQVLKSLFFRNKGAYIVGRVVNQSAIYPFAIALLHNAAGQIRLDAFLHGEDLSTLFSFTRAYFLVDMQAPAAYVHFLTTLLPRKPKAELYSAIGLQKQGKTLFYRDFLHHLAHSHDAFDMAAGTRGMVMTVFTLPSYPYVFKLIRDHIVKDGMTHATVRRKYQLVKAHDRVGRMADTWEYSQVALPRNRFSPALLGELRGQVADLIEETADTVVLRHVYIERRMTPLNLYLMRCSDHALDVAIEGYGNAIRDLAAANIFPGDMLYKNFGVTRLGRVVFYDYDEIQLMTEMNFRAIPPAPNEEAEMASEPWYAVGKNDVFPEEFRYFLLGDDRIRAAFLKHHPELLEAHWWQACRERATQGRIEDIFPYDSSRRLTHPAAPLTY